ncbi:hypothetical protein L2E82_06195 [Cichorium intybus]|uniref:Uncharacterized protein n=1 Tax=Cichorium intybus TaxID=13427 RepID=A0ACB9HAV7_CICIN|nr:hypothetical protein L2E82_06195 [Cichorium intybus]
MWGASKYPIIVIQDSTNTESIETTKSVLIASTHIHLKCNNFVKYTLNLPTVCPRILLSGPAGSEIHQETLTKALAKHFGVRFLVVDSLSLPGGSVAKETDTLLKESTRAKRANFFTKRVKRAGAMHSKKGDIHGCLNGVCGSTTCSYAQPKQEASTTTSKSHTFKEEELEEFQKLKVKKEAKGEKLKRAQEMLEPMDDGVIDGDEGDAEEKPKLDIVSLNSKGIQVQVDSFIVLYFEYNNI